MERVMREAHAKHQGAQPKADLPATDRKKTRLNIDGRIVEVGDEFLSMTREQQDATVDEIARELKVGPFAPKLVPVDHDPFAAQPTAGSNVAAKGDRQRAAPKLVPVDHNPFMSLPDAAPAEQSRAAPIFVPVDHDPFAPQPGRGMIEIHGPDGSINRFPAGTDDATIIRAMQEIFGGPAPVNAASKEAAGSSVVAKGDRQGMAPSNAQVTTQALGKGVADILGTPSDLNSLGQAATDYAVHKADSGMRHLINWIAGTDLQPTEPRARPPQPFGSDAISGAASDVAESVGIDVADREEMTGGQRLLYDTTRYGSQAGLGGAGFARAGIKAGTSAAGSRLLSPYVEKPIKAIVGDIGGGVGVGGALNVLDEYLPESVGQHPLARLIVALAGGKTGSFTVNTATRAPSATLQAVTDRLPASQKFQDKSSALPASRRSAQQAVNYVHEKASDPKSALAQMLESVNFFNDAGGAIPTTGLMTDDVGLQLIENDLRKANPKPFLERDSAVRTSVYQDVGNLRPDDGNPYRPRQVSEDEIAARTGAADAAVRAKQDQLASADKSDALLGSQFEQPPMNREEASIALDKALIGDTAIPMRTTKGDLYKSIDPEGTEMIDTENLVALAKELERVTQSYPPSTRGRMAPEGLISDIKAYEPKIDPKTGENVGGPGRVSFRNLNEWRKPLSELENEARRAGQAGIADSIAKIRRAIGHETEALATSGSLAGERAAEANRFYKEDYRPFREGEVGNLMRDMARNPQRDRTPPSATASRLIAKGPGAPETGRNVNEAISRGTPEAQKAAREAIKSYFLADLRNVVRNGKVDENKLQRWINVNASTLDAYPDFKKEVVDLLENVRGRGVRNSQLEAELKEAVAGRQATEREINRSAFSIFAGREPEKAVAALFAADDPASMVRQFRTRFAGDREADAGLRAAVADHIIDQVRTAGRAGVAGDALPVSLAKIETTFRRNEKLLKEVFGSDLRYLNQARKRLEALSRRTNAGTGPAPIERTGFDRLGRAALKPVEIVAKIVFGQLQGGGYARSAKLLSGQMPDSTAAAQELILRMSFEPELAKHLLSATPKAVATPRWNKKLAQLMRWAEAGRAGSEDEDRGGQ